MCIRDRSRVILGAAVIDDILAMLLLGVVVALQAGGEIHVGQLAIVLLEACLLYTSRCV